MVTGKKGGGGTLARGGLLHAAVRHGGRSHAGAWERGGVWGFVRMITGKEAGEGTLSRADLLHVDRICDRFEDAWRGGERPDLASFLAEASAPSRPLLFRGLLTLELEFRISSDVGPGAAASRE